MKVYQNYHKHTCWSNIMTTDSPSSIEDYAKRAKELGHGILSSLEHGWQGNYYKVYETAKKYDLKFIFGVEAYWVKNRFEKDRTNSHIVLLAKNEEGRRELNDILSEANITGYYAKPRVDLELLLSLNPNNIMVTSACVAFFHYEDIESIIVKLHNHFKTNFYLEVQFHNTDSQKKLNEKVLKLSNKYNIDIIMGCDSHYILESDSKERDNLLEAKGIFYEGEEGWFLDYPNYDIAFERFKTQGILTEEEITKAMDNTNIVLNFNDMEFNKDIKLPTLYPNKTQEWKDNKLRELINKSWKTDYLPFLSKEQKKIYLEGIRNELETITETKMTDYFLLDYEIVKEGKKRGGIISKTARGSGGSFFINTLLGFSNLNRFEAPVKLYPERFMSKTRILSSKSLPDLDLNLGTVEIFVEVQKELLGENHAYPMIAFGQLKTSSAFKLYCKSQGLEFELANEISKQIQKYEKALKNADSEEEKELINLYDYVDEKYKTYIDESKKYQGIIDNKHPHPCFAKGTLVMTSKGYREIQDIEIGDYVLTHTNTFQKVINTMSHMSKDINKLKTTGENILVTDNHPMYVITETKGYDSTSSERKWTKTYSKPHWKQIKELNKDDRIGLAINQESNIPTWEGCYYGKKFRKNELNFNDENFWWLIGRYIGDGWTEHPRKDVHAIKICCNKNNNELNDIKSKIPSNFHYYVQEDRTVYKIIFHNKMLFEYLNQFGKYAKYKKLTSDIYNLPIDLLQAFLKGYFSADGHIEENKIGFTTISKELAYGLQQCIHKVYKRPCKIYLTKEGQDVIEGRIVNRSKKYRGVFSIEECKNDRYIYKDGYIWIPFKERETISHNDLVYNMTVENDNSYTVNNLIAHNCGYFLYQGDIRREIGLIKCKSESTKKEYITTVVDGYVAEEYKFVKNDLLKVDVANTVKKIYNSIGIEQHNIKELTEIIENDIKTWNIYSDGYTLGVNQMESNFGVQCCKQYKPKTVAEITALVSALRPGFKSMLQNFLARNPYSTGVEALDDLLEDSFHYIMYQENIMTYLGWLGIEQTETYAIIKKISKKKFTPEKLKELKGRLSTAWSNNTGSLDGFEESFHVVEDFSKYAFNASHAYAYAYDSLYGAYLKANYPYHFYSVMLQTYTDKGKKDKVTAYKKEMSEAFEIQEGKYKFRLDNRSFAIDEENNCINPSLASIKNMGKNAPQELYDMRNDEYNSFIEVLQRLKTTTLNKTMIELLIKLDYFSEFGSPSYLLKIVDIYNQWSGRKTIKKEQVEELGYDIELFEQFGRSTEKQFNNLDANKLIQHFISKLEDKTSVRDRLIYQHESCGYCFNRYVKHRDKGLVLDVDLTNAPLITIYLLDTGEEIKYKAYKKTYNKNIIKQYDMIQIGNTTEKPKTKKVGDDWIEIGGTWIWLNGWKKLNN